MLTNEIAKLKAEGKEIRLHNAECALRRLEEAKPTGLKYKDSDGKVYETFSWFYISRTGGKRWQHAHKYENEWGVLTNNVSKSRCFK